MNFNAKSKEHTLVRMLPHDNPNNRVLYYYSLDGVTMILDQKAEQLGNYNITEILNAHHYELRKL